MASEDKPYMHSELQRHWEMYPNRLSSGVDGPLPAASVPSDSRSAATTPNGSGMASAPASQTTGPNPAATARTYEQVYHDMLEQNFRNRIVQMDPSRSVSPKTVPSTTASEPTPSSSSSKKDEYITTVYNITPRELPATPSPHMTPCGAILLNGIGLSDGTKRSNVVPVIIPASKPALETATQQQTQQSSAYKKNTDTVMLAQHQRPNMMLDIIKPKVKPPAPPHVYGAPDVGPTTLQQQHPPPKQYSPRLGRTGHRILSANEKVTVEYINEPPPAHSFPMEAPSAMFTQTTSTAPSVTSNSVPKGQSQIEALNLDTKHDSGSGGNLVKVVSVLAFPANTSISSPELNRTIAHDSPSTEESLRAATCSITSAASSMKQSLKESPVAAATISSTRAPLKQSATKERSLATTNQSLKECLAGTAYPGSRNLLKQPTSSINPATKEKLLASLSGIKKESQKQSPGLTKANAKESGLATASTSSTLDSPTQAGSIAKPALKECLFGASLSSAQESINQPAVVTHPKTKASPLEASTSTQGSINQPAVVMHPKMKESLRRASLSCAPEPLEQSAVGMNSKTKEILPGGATSTSALELLQQPAVAMDTKTKESPLGASLSSAPEPPKLSTVDMNPKTKASPLEASTSTQASIIQLAVLMHPKMKESLLGASLPSTQESINQPAVVMLPKTKQSPLGATSTSALELLKQPAVGMDRKTKESPLGASLSSAQESITQPAVLMHPKMKESLLGASLPSAQESINQPAVVMLPKTKQSPLGATSTSALELLKQPAVGMDRKTKESPLGASLSSAQESIIQPAVVMHPKMKESLLGASLPSAQESINQPAVVMLPKTKEIPLGATSASALELLKQPAVGMISKTKASPLEASTSTQAVVMHPKRKESPLGARSSSAPEPLKQTAVGMNPKTKEILPGGAALTSAPEHLKPFAVGMNPKTKEILPGGATLTSATGLLMQSAVCMNPKTKEILPGGATLTSATGPLIQPTIAMNPKTKESLLATTSTTSSPRESLNQPNAIVIKPKKKECLLASVATTTKEQLKPAGFLNPTTKERLQATLTTTAQVSLNQLATVTHPGTAANDTKKIVQKVSAVPSAFNANPAIWEQLQKYNLQHLLAQVMLQTNKAAAGVQTQTNQPPERIQPSSAHTVVPSAANSTPLAMATLSYHPAKTITPAQSPATYDHLQRPFIALSPSTMTKLEYEQLLYQKIQAMKRKNPPKDTDPNKRRRSNPRPKRPTEAFLQNGPCYKVASRLPRCRECGRSAAVRSRNASIIFCRFIAFRKLKYNDSGQLEVYGFADPIWDAKEADTSLWSSNLQKVPADLSVEKSKFLLGQVGYKFCELFHQEKEAYYEHMAEDKTIAWKQAVQGVREMCDVCQTTLFNHHWVCSTCGFVVCIDCYKCRKNGIITADSSAKDKDANGWLLCSATKEPHDQTRLMLTQIIPSKCLYTLVRQMHGICALLEIPLNCDCPLTREPPLRKIMDQLKFIYPLMPDEAGGALEFTGGEVSVTIKHIEQMTTGGSYGKVVDGLKNEESDPYECRIVFMQQYRECREQQNAWPSSCSGQEEANEAAKEKQSYSFDGFEREIHAAGDHFDERLYKATAVSKAPVKAEHEQDGDKMLTDSPDDEGVVLGTNSNESFVMESETEHQGGGGGVPNVKQEPNGLVHNRTSNGSQEGSGNVPLKTECAVPAANGNGTANDNGTKEVPQTLPVPYSEEDRFKPSPTVDEKTVTMIIKQVVKTDKSIFPLLQPHMVSTRHQLNDFVECVSIQRERAKQFVAEFLDEFIFLKGQNGSDDLVNDRGTVDYNRSMKEGSARYRNKSERRMNLVQSKTLYPDVAHDWLCNGRLLRLLDPLDVHNYRVFHEQWERGQPVMVSAVSSKMNMDLWLPGSFGRDFGDQVNDLINCLNGKIVRGHPMRVFWEGFEELSERLLDERERPMMLKLKDWPPGDDFAEMMPTRFYDLMKSLPLAEYTRREGRLNLASRLSSFFVRPDLGPKMYSAYGSALHPTKGTTNLHLDISDAVNVMVYVGVPRDVPSARYNEKIVELIDSEDCDYLTRQRVRERKELPGALWHIYHAQDADKIRALLNRIELERGGTIKPNHDPIHDQKWYLDRNLRKRLQQEYHVEGYAIVQCAGDAIFIPAGAPHQVRNLHNCIKVAEDFVSPENVSHCLKLTNEFRHLSGTHSNHEDKLQIKNIIYHTVKDAVSSITNPLIRMARGEDERWAK
ncbi:mucin-12 [Anopheles arabiensis]|uniref:mucin-12 n=1 Tax=Anopheles arabiensis TaxID=7173 RepID=UPI001AADD48F|nr:mucin-12 [Anopheles arabiensis]